MRAPSNCPATRYGGTATRRTLRRVSIEGADLRACFRILRGSPAHLRPPFTASFPITPRTKRCGILSVPEFYPLLPCVPCGSVRAHFPRTQTAMSYAVIKTGGKQYRVAKGDTLSVEKLEGEAG